MIIYIIESRDILKNICQSAYGTGFCLKDNTPSPTAYEQVTATVTSAPKNYAAPTMAEDIDDSFGFTVPIPIPTIPASFFPDVPPISPLAGSGTSTKKKIVAAIQSASIDTTSTTTTTPTPTTPSPTPTESSGHHHRQHHKHGRKGHHDCKHHDCKHHKSKKQQKDKKSKD